MLRLIIFTGLIALFSCRENKRLPSSDKINSSKGKLNNSSDTIQWDSLKNSTVLSFLDKVSINKTDNKGFNFVTIEDDGTPKNWIKPADIDTLIALVKSKEPCKCIVDPLSSYLPINDHAELGGYAILLLRQYQGQKDIRFKLYDCPKTDDKSAEELIKWRAETKR